LKEQGRWLTSEVEVPAQALLAQAGDMEGWQRWRADQLRQELVAKAEALTTAPEGQRLGGRKMQEVLRGLRESWKQADHGGAPNHALWKRFDEACNQAHKLVEEWLGKLKAESAAHKAQRMALIQEVLAWAQAGQASTDWKVHARELHRFAETWRNAGHLSEKQFADIQPQWKAAMDQARAPLEAAQAANLAQRHALIEQAVALGAADVLRMDAVRALQHDWQHPRASCAAGAPPGAEAVGCVPQTH
jgi:ATP-dependent RNA helicase SUPV3L1/SUV3